MDPGGNEEYEVLGFEAQGITSANIFTKIARPTILKKEPFLDS